MSPRGAQPTPDTVSRGPRDKQPRAFGGGRGVRIVGSDDGLIEVCTSEKRLKSYKDAPNAEVKYRTDGSIRLIRLLGYGDDRGHLGEKHGRSTVTTQRERDDWGGLIGSEANRKHKHTCYSWPPPKVSTDPAPPETRHSGPGFLYPRPTQTTIGPKFPALARPSAGLREDTQRTGGVS
jgi:hypothetical protein